jgi:hypothetical protein
VCDGDCDVHDEGPFPIGSGEDDAVCRKPVETINHRVTLQHRRISDGRRRVAVSNDSITVQRVLFSGINAAK